MSEPLVSICMPLYNGERFVQTAVTSVLRQTYANWELIVRDDASTDQSGELVRKITDGRVRYYHNAETLGMQRNFNRLLEAARGKYIKLLCQDDVLHPDCLRRQVDIMEAPGNERVVLVTSAREVIDANGQILFVRKWHAADRCVPGLSAVRQMVRSGSNLVGEPSAVLFRADAPARYDGFDGRFPYVIDVDFWIRLLVEMHCYYFAEPLCQFRVSRYSGSFSISGQQGSQFVAFAREIRHNPKLRLSMLDIVMSCLSAHGKALLRQAFYRLYWRRLHSYDRSQ